MIQPGTPHRILINGSGGEIGSVLASALLGAGHAMASSEENADAVVDFTDAKAVVNNVLRALNAGVPCVVGTTGWDPAEIEPFAIKAGVPVVYASEFALGAVLLTRFAREASRYFDGAEIIEVHDPGMRESPSATAAATAEALGGEAPIHSLRLPGLVARHEVLLGGSGETLTIRHDRSSPKAVIAGVRLALSKLATLPPGVTVGLESLLAPDPVSPEAPSEDGAAEASPSGEPVPVADAIPRRDLLPPRPAS
jgi:4-hydroxy-tetrahydrodipicolinate reductase